MASPKSSPKERTLMAMGYAFTFLALLLWRRVGMRQLSAYIQLTLIKKKEMKAAVMYQKGELPQYMDFPEPTVQNDNEVLVTVKAVAIKHFDKGRAAGKHYSGDAPKENGQVIGGDGVCLLDDGTRIYGMGVSGMLAEKATVDKDRIVKLPDGLDDATAAALPNAVIGAATVLNSK
jgi:NADPH:quinone reductase-like Zn-dependent oxidoreductase